jgi:hypothetical protein
MEILFEVIKISFNRIVSLDWMESFWAVTEIVARLKSKDIL